jgi:hypothetical protein
MSVQVTMLQTRRGEDGTLWTVAGSPYTASDAFAQFLISANLATGVFPQLPQSSLNTAQVIAVQALLDGSGTDVSFLRSFNLAANGFTMDAGSGNVLPVMRLVVNAPTDVIAGDRISNGGANTFETTITGESLQGEVIPVSVGSGVITSVHIGSSAGADQVIDENNTITNSEIGKWIADEADDCNVVYVRFGVPRSSGRYCDVTIVGKKRGG